MRTEQTENTQKTEGRNAVLEALRSGRPVEKVFLLDGCQDGPIRSIVRKQKAAHSGAVRAAGEAGQNVRDGKHQGPLPWWRLMNMPVWRTC